MSPKWLCLLMELGSLCEVCPIKCPLKYLFCLQSTTTLSKKKNYLHPPKSLRPRKKEETLASTLNVPSLSTSRSHSHLFPSLRCATGRDESERLSDSFGAGVGRRGYSLSELCEGDACGVKVPFQSEESKGNKTPWTAFHALNNIDHAVFSVNLASE